ncbi:MAG: hypothetical protein ACREBS_09555 [Nitrososphaerales archaeon]
MPKRSNLMLLDTSTLVEISGHEKTSKLILRIKQIVTDEQPFVSIVQIAEIAG